MPWPEQPFERQLHKSLLKSKQFDALTGDKYFDHYKQARTYLIEQIYPFIPAREPDLTDHTERHIRDVLKNVDILLNSFYKSMLPMDLYLLGLCVLMHDTGNIIGRGVHADYDVIAKIYDNVFPKTSALMHERRVITSAAAAHSGLTKDGSTDTLKDLAKTDNLDGYSVRLQEMAAVLRFADELAEGPQRTSQFMQDHGLYSPGSRIYHDYANSTNVHIDRPLQRIALTYEFKISSRGKALSTKQEREFRNLLTFTYARIEKLNQERSYARHYSDYFADFKRTSVAINIEKNGRSILNLTDCALEDRVIPGQTHYAPLESQFEMYHIDTIIREVNRS